MVGSRVYWRGNFASDYDTFMFPDDFPDQLQRQTSAGYAMVSHFGDEHEQGVDSLVSIYTLSGDLIAQVSYRVNEHAPVVFDTASFADEPFLSKQEVQEVIRHAGIMAEDAAARGQLTLPADWSADSYRP